MPLSYFLGISIVMFTIGVLGVLLRRNALVILMSLELMFNSANLLFVAYANYHQILTGQIMVFFVMAVAAAEVGIGLAVLVAIFRVKKSIDIDQMSSLKG
jgi:NADH-quinone oxidoreductase subunit K